MTWRLFVRKRLIVEAETSVAATRLIVTSVVQMASHPRG